MGHVKEGSSGVDFGLNARAAAGWQIEVHGASAGVECPGEGTTSSPNAGIMNGEAAKIEGAATLAVADRADETQVGRGRDGPGIKLRDAEAITPVGACVDRAVLGVSERAHLAEGGDFPPDGRVPQRPIGTGVPVMIGCGSGDPDVRGRDGALLQKLYPGLKKSARILSP